MRSSAASSNVGSASESSEAWTISTSLPNSSAMTPMASSDSVCVSVAISPMPMSFLMISGTGTPRYSATSLTVEPELTLTTSVRVCAPWSSGVIVSSYVPRRRRPRPRGGRRGGPWGPPPGPPGPPGPRRDAWESMTTRRRPPAPALPGARSPRRSPRLGRRPLRRRRRRRRRPGPGAGVRPRPSRRPGVRRPPSAGRVGPARRAARRGCRCAGRRPESGCAEGRADPCASAALPQPCRSSPRVPRWAGRRWRAWPASRRPRRPGLHLDAGSAEALDDLLGGHVVLARQLVDSLLCHSLSDTSGDSFVEDDGRAGMHAGTRVAGWRSSRQSGEQT